MVIELAKSAGFCFGVKRVINMINEAINDGKKICTLGHIIHNQNVIDDLNKKGVRIINNINDVHDDETIIIRSHGTSKDVYNQIISYSYMDGTCPFVTKIHNIVSDIFIDPNNNEIIDNDKIQIIIIGNQNHPEIKGIEGHCIYKFKTIGNSSELQEWITHSNDLNDKYIKVVFQTTYQIDEFKKCVNILKNSNYNYEIFDTICNETKKRQIEAEQMSKVKDLMIIVGDKNSSNTQKLINVCKNNCSTIFISTASDLNKYDYKKYQNIGITAGASTPYEIIEDVINKLENDDESDINFENELDNFINTLFIGKQVTAAVIKITDKEAQLDIGNMYDAYLPLNEIAYNPNTKMSDLIKVGDQLNVIVTKIDDINGVVTLSKKKYDKLIADKTINHAFENNLPLQGVVTKILKDGIIVNVYGINIYINEHQTCANKNQLNNLLGQTVKFKITLFDKKNKKIKGSIKELNKELFWSNVKLGDKMSGIVKNITNFGAFVDLHGENGLILIQDLSWAKIKHPSEILKVGQTVDVYIKNIDYENKKITLGYKKDEDDPWSNIKNYNIGDIVDATIVSITPFGAFAQIAPNLDGLIHISEISEQYVKYVQDHLSVGEKVSVKITNIDPSKKKISLSLKSL